jgi:hypothetical protein
MQESLANLQRGKGQQNVFCGTGHFGGTNPMKGISPRLRIAHCCRVANGLFCEARIGLAPADRGRAGEIIRSSRATPGPVGLGRLDQLGQRAGDVVHRTARPGAARRSSSHDALKFWRPQSIRSVLVLAKSAMKGFMVVVNKSTVPVGTGDEV